MVQSREAFGYASDGRQVTAVRLASPDLSATILTRGAVLQDVRLPGVDHSLTLGSPRLDAYEGPMGYFGSIVGPVANRLAGAEAEIGGRTFRFPPNEGATLLHGGATGLHTRHWAIDASGPDFVRLWLVLAEGDGSFPGRREIRAEFRIDGPALTLTLEAESDALTLMNLANHSYWNLDGHATTKGHRLQVAADRYLPVTPALIPTGERRAVSGAFDLRAGRELDGSEGFDHNFCLSDAPRPLTEVARLTGTSGISMELATTEPGLQIYDAARLSTWPVPGHGGVPYGAHAGVALEPQRWPDAPHHPGFPTILLSPGETYRQLTRWTFRR